MAAIQRPAPVLQLPCSLSILAVLLLHASAPPFTAGRILLPALLVRSYRLISNTPHSAPAWPRVEGLVLRASDSCGQAGLRPAAVKCGWLSAGHRAECSKPVAAAAPPLSTGGAASPSPLHQVEGQGKSGERRASRLQ